MSAISINKNNFDEALKSEKTVLLDFYASWCGPCRMLSPVVDKIAKENPQYLVGKINVDEEEDLAMQFGVTSIPALFVLKEGKIINQSLGAIPEQKILELLEG
ncbi:MAG: thioredoxin [Ruminococcaceae bacterium]|nr:thioredoxin [Oscillospiraceae bacterium]